MIDSYCIGEPVNDGSVRSNGLTPSPGLKQPGLESVNPTLTCFTEKQISTRLISYFVRPLAQLDQALLWEMLYQSLFVPEGCAPFEHSALDRPEIARYVEDWGRTNDSGFVAINENGSPVGATWMRLFGGDEKGFGYVDDETPELGMAVLPEYRGQGIGTMLLSRLIDSTADYKFISLSVAANNPAFSLYQKFGFEVVARDGDTLTMKKRLTLVEQTNRAAENEQ